MMKAKKVLIAALIVVCLIFAQGTLSNISKAIPASVSAQSGNLPDTPLAGNYQYVPSQILVVMANPVSLSSVTTNFLGQDILSIRDLTDMSALISSTAVNPYTGPQILLLELASEDEGDLLNAISALESNNLVISAELNLLGSTCSISSEPFPFSEELWGLMKIEMHDAWKISKGNPSALLGLLDSGFSYHPSLLENLSDLGRNLLAENPYFFYDDPFDVSDDFGHGTTISGIAVDTGNNYTGASGVAPKANIVPLKIIDGGGNASLEGLITGLIYADHVGIPIVNLGATWHGESNMFRAMEIAVSCYSGLLLVPIGNAGIDNDSNQNLASYPASFSNLPNVISVAASNPEDALAAFSSYGQISTLLCAPGSDILSSSVYYCWDIENCDIEEFNYNDGWYTEYGYEYWAGTSISSAFVAGAAILLKSANPTLTASEIKTALLENTDYCSELDGLVATSGRLNVFQALLSVVPIYFDEEVYFDYSKLAACCSINALIPDDYLITASVVSEGDFEPGYDEQIISLSGSDIVEIYFDEFEGFEISICEITVKIFDSTGSVLYAEATCNTDIIHAKK